SSTIAVGTTDGVAAAPELADIRGASGRQGSTAPRPRPIRMRAPHRLAASPALRARFEIRLFVAGLKSPSTAAAAKLSAAPVARVTAGGRIRPANHQAMPRNAKPKAILTRSIQGPAFGRKRAPAVPNTIRGTPLPSPRKNKAAAPRTTSPVWAI